MRSSTPFRMAVFLLATALTSLAHGQASAAPPRKLVIEEYGDSTTQGVKWVDANWDTPAKFGGGYVISKQSATAVTSAMLRGKYGDRVDYRVIGAGGSTLVDLLAGNRDFKIPWSERMRNSDADIVILNFGINDAYTEGTTATTYLSNMESAVKIAESFGKRAIIETSNPIKMNGNPRLGIMLEGVRKYAKDNNILVIDQYRVLSENRNWNAMLSDGVHPNDEGYRMKGNVEFYAIDSAVEKMIVQKHR